MAVEVTYPIWKWSKQKGARLLLLVAIGDYANAEGIAWPSIRSLAKRTRMTDRYVQKMLREIEADGEIEIIKRTNTSNVYRVRIQQPPPEQLPGELEFAPPVKRETPGGEPGFSIGVNPRTPNPLVEPSTNRTSTVPAEAEAIYQAYPRKVGKQGALKAISKALKSIDAEKLLSATLGYAAAVSGWPEEERIYVPHPATWFNRGSYEDDPINWQRKRSTNGHAPNQKPNGRLFEQANLGAYRGYTHDTSMGPAFRSVGAVGGDGQDAGE